MEWLITWWNELTFIGQIMACAAIPMTVVMILQLVLMLIGIGFDSDTDSDIDDGVIDDGVIDSHAETPPHESSSNGGASILKIFTVRGIVAFFALGGWAGLAAVSADLHPIWVIQISLLVGVCALLLAAIVIRLALRMQTSGNLNLNNAISQTAEVYIRIPPARTEKGKVTMLLQERFVELDAVTDSEVELMPTTKVDVVALVNEDCLVVYPVSEETSH